MSCARSEEACASMITAKNNREVCFVMTTYPRTRSICSILAAKREIYAERTLYLIIHPNMVRQVWMVIESPFFILVGVIFSLVGLVIAPSYYRLVR